MRGLQALPLFFHIGFWEGPRVGAANHVSQHTNRRGQEGWCWELGGRNCSVRPVPH